MQASCMVGLNIAGVYAGQCQPHRPDVTSGSSEAKMPSQDWGQFDRLNCHVNVEGGPAVS